VARQGPGSLDVAVGQRVRAFRLQKGLSQQKLAEHLGVTVQQVQKYENGAKRIGAGSLQVIATLLGVPTFGFFDAAVPQASPLLRAYSRIRPPKLQ
jgi:transcriptional regulator with XRE-family HTH domain